MNLLNRTQTGVLLGIDEKQVCEWKKQRISLGASTAIKGDLMEGDARLIFLTWKRR